MTRLRLVGTFFLILAGVVAAAPRAEDAPAPPPAATSPRTDGDGLMGTDGDGLAFVPLLVRVKDRPPGETGQRQDRPRFSVGPPKPARAAAVRPPACFVGERG